MLRTRRLTPIFSGAALLALAGCGGRGQPAEAPRGGEVDVGYGTRPADRVTGAVSSVTGAELGETRSAGAGVMELLRGRVAGLQVVPRSGGGHSFRIRGLDTGVSDPPEPLFVVDGAQVSADHIEAALAGLTRDDIRRVDVLKDISSTSIYGTRGVGGVIIITTKRR